MRTESEFLDKISRMNFRDIMREINIRRKEINLRKEKLDVIKQIQEEVKGK